MAVAGVTVMRRTNTSLRLQELVYTRRSAMSKFFEQKQSTGLAAVDFQVSSPSHSTVILSVNIPTTFHNDSWDVADSTA